jgi:hypothetical protein
MGAEALFVVGVFFGEEMELVFGKEFIVFGEEFLPCVVALIVGGESGDDSALVVLSDYLGVLESRVARN